MAHRPLHALALDPFGYGGVDLHETLRSSEHTLGRALAVLHQQGHAGLAGVDGDRDQCTQDTRAKWFFLWEH